jgi:hypothetical protein
MQAMFAFYDAGVLAAVTLIAGCKITRIGGAAIQASLRSEK